MIKRWIYAVCLVTALAGCIYVDNDDLDYEQRIIEEDIDILKKEYTELSEQLGGSLITVESQKELESSVSDMVSGKTGADIAFLVDDSASMDGEYNLVRALLNSFSGASKTGPRLALATFSDNNVDPDNWFTLHADLAQGADLSQYIYDITPAGGDDLPESIYDALFTAADSMSWQSQSERIIICISDAIPHSNEMTRHSLNDVIQKTGESSPAITVIMLLVLQ